MDFSEVVHGRRMVRHFTGEPVSEAVLHRILDAARRGPSAGFTQGQDFVVVTDATQKARIAELCGELHYLIPQ
jgi:nitroreductase